MLNVGKFAGYKSKAKHLPMLSTMLVYQKSSFTLCNIFNTHPYLLFTAPLFLMPIVLSFPVDSFYTIL